MENDTHLAPSAERTEISRNPTTLFALAVGVVVLPLYASQPLVGIIGPDLGLPPALAGLATTSTLLGYAAGLFLLVPLTDVVENRRLILTTLAGDVVALAALAVAPNAAVFLITSFVVGLLTSAIQMLVPVAASLSSDRHRGRTVGNVMSGLMLGILVSRPIASLITQTFGWRSLYALLGFAVAILVTALGRFVPTIHPAGQTGYGRLIGSLGSLLGEEPILRRRAASQAMCMGAFGVFWTSIALKLAQPPLSLAQWGIALFAFAGAAGAIVAPMAGRAGDRGLTRPATASAHGAIIVAMGLAYLGGAVFSDGGPVSLALLLAAAILLDLGVIADQTLGRRAINLLRPEARGRMNGLFTGLFFLGAAAGSALSGIAWDDAGWSGVCASGLAFGMGAIGAFLSKGRPSGQSEAV